MKKFILGFMTLAMIGCTNESSTLRDLRESNDELKLQLGSCKSRLEVHESVSENSAPSQPETPPEPTCEETDYDVLYVDGKKLDTCQHDSVETKECGVSATNCDSHMAYACLRSVSYKTETRKKCE